MNTTQDFLFYREANLRNFLEQRQKAIVEEIQGQDPNYILNVSEDDFCQYLVSKFLLKSPELLEDQIHVTNQKEVNIDVSKDHNRDITDRSRPFYIKGVQITIAVPFIGDRLLFCYQPSRYTFNPPRGKVHDKEIHLIYEKVDYDAEKLKKEYTNDLNRIRDYLEWVKNDVDRFNNSLESFVKQTVSQRKQKLLANQGLVSSLGIPIKRREDLPKTYTVPTIQRKPKIERPQVTEESYKPEPTLSEEEYEHILSIINNMTLVMERSPKTFTKLAEEEIRDHFLMHLNGHYDGQATGETFNYQGKTDILIRVEGKNVFIAECKFWKGEKPFLDTIHQLLGYTSWRDTKTAILLFNTNQNFSSVLDKIGSVTKSHDCYKRGHQLKNTSLKNETTFSYIFHLPYDKNRELVLTVMAFNIPR